MPVGRAGRKKHNTGTFKNTKTFQIPENVTTALILRTYIYQNEGLSYNESSRPAPSSIMGFIVFMRHSAFIISFFGQM
jgi:hypothetical protein